MTGFEKAAQSSQGGAKIEVIASKREQKRQQMPPPPPQVKTEWTAQVISSSGFQAPPWADQPLETAVLDVMKGGTRIEQIHLTRAATLFGRCETSFECYMQRSWARFLFVCRHARWTCALAGRLRQMWCLITLRSRGNMLQSATTTMANGSLST
jgi:hypothetical protein